MPSPENKGIIAIRTFCRLEIEYTKVHRIVPAHLRHQTTCHLDFKSSYSSAGEFLDSWLLGPSALATNLLNPKEC